MYRQIFNNVSPVTVFMKIRPVVIELFRAGRWKDGRTDVTKLTTTHLNCFTTAPEDVIWKYELDISTYYPVFAWCDWWKLQTASLHAGNNVASPDYKSQTLRKKLKVRNLRMF